MSTLDGEHRHEKLDVRMIKVSSVKEARLYDQALAQVEKTATGRGLEQLQRARAMLADYIERDGKASEAGGVE